MLTTFYFRVVCGDNSHIRWLKKNLDCENKYIDFILLNIWLENISFLWKTSPIPWRFAKMMTDVSIWVKSSRVGLTTTYIQINKQKFTPFLGAFAIWVGTSIEPYCETGLWICGLIQRSINFSGLARQALGTGDLFYER